MADKPIFEPTTNQLTRAWALDHSRKAIAGGTGAGFGGLVGGTSAPVKNVGNLIQLAEWLIDGLGTDEADAADEAAKSNPFDHPLDNPFDDPFIKARNTILEAQMSIGNKLLVAADIDGLLELDEDARAALFEEARQSLDELPAAVEAHQGQHALFDLLRRIGEGSTTVSVGLSPESTDAPKAAEPTPEEEDDHDDDVQRNVAEHEVAAQAEGEAQ